MTGSDFRFLDFININYLVLAQCTTLTLITLQLHNGSDFALIKIFYSGSYLNKIQNTGGPPLTGFHYLGSHYRGFLLMYTQVGGFHISKGPPTVSLTRILRNAVFSSPKFRVRWGPSVYQPGRNQMCQS